jgi:hypothetical protein
MSYYYCDLRSRYLPYLTYKYIQSSYDITKEEIILLSLTSFFKILNFIFWQENPRKEKVSIWRIHCHDCHFGEYIVMIVTLGNTLLCDCHFVMIVIFGEHIAMWLSLWGTHCHVIVTLENTLSWLSLWVIYCHDCHFEEHIAMWLSLWKSVFVPEWSDMFTHR